MIVSVACIWLSACTTVSGWLQPKPKTAVVEAAMPIEAETTAPAVSPLPPVQDPIVDVPPPPKPNSLRTVATLGDPTKPGLWLETPLVDSEQSGRVTAAKTGKSATLTLIPIEGEDTAGSRMSLAAFQALGASLTDLVELDVAQGG
jgi:hypothetical protein